MTFTKKELFEKTRLLWPDSVDLNGQYFGEIFITGGEVLNEIYQKIESSLDKNDHWMQISCWSFHQAIEKPVGDSALISILNDVSYEVYEKMMLENLNGDECWQAELKIYGSLESD
ncbi:hypothetical protein [Pseudoalteromonas sp. NBT06-2]|uniref:hypothetical protein n=1 Tax=Pseudoalteromonas sp. NBT06-2 TaxID=2025950 RepID=UPI001140B0B5|nr:hypothetical protein [Pseudoalteromonas sp. NBT06-2]